MNNENIIVSICCQTYNHKNFIKRSVESFLMQKTNFTFEILLRDDASTDGTTEIVKEYSDKYPKLIKPLLYNENQWVRGVKPLSDNVKRAKGKYIALCEGDDYWTDPYKLQKQVNFLEENEDYVMSFHSVDIKNSIPKGEVHSNYKYPIPIKNTLTLKDLAFKHYIPTCSLVFRADAMPNPIPNWFANLPMGDIPLELMIASKGFTIYFSESMAVHMKHDNSLTANKKRRLNGRASYLYLYNNLRKKLGAKYWLIFTILITKHRLGVLKDYIGFNPILR